jgi:hypothetical protein
MMLRNWLLWTMLVAVTCGMVAGCSGPDSNKGGSDITTDSK